MSPREINDDHAAELSDLRDVHIVVDRLRQLFAAAFEANRVRETSRFDEPFDWRYQSAPGR